MTKAPNTTRPTDDSPEWLIHYHDNIAPFWQQVECRELTSFDETRLHWCFYKVSEDAPLIVFSPGRIEAALKYQEVMWELAQAGISCAVLDHRGQGASQRMTANPHQGHVDNFNDFIEDFGRFDAAVGEVFAHACKRWLVGHSMGGTIATLYLHGRTHRYDELVLSSPMFSINTAGIPVAIAKSIAAAGVWLNSRLMPNTPWYFFGMTDYSPVEFGKNELTHSQHRYQVFRELYQQQPEVQLGGPTFNWLHQALLACDRASQGKLSISCPITLFQAGGDSVVSATGQDRFVRNNNAEKVVIADAKHELLMESDRYRAPVMSKLLSIRDESASVSPSLRL